MHLVRYRCDHDQARIGILRDGQVTGFPEVGSIAELLALPLADLRPIVDAAAAGAVASRPAATVQLLPPLDGRGEVWCSGVTYERSRSGRVAESSERSVYDRVYTAERPELFLKSPAWRVVTDGEPIGIRADSGHDVPEPELAVVANAHGEIVGYTICDDVSSRSLEGENPLYLPQAKVFAGGCALAAGIRPQWEVPDPTALTITLAVLRDGRPVFTADTSTGQMVRPLQDLVDYLFRANDFPDGVVLATGTGIVPGLSFTLRPGDVVDIAIEHVGRLVNPVAVGTEPFTWLSTPTRTRPNPQPDAREEPAAR